MENIDFLSHNKNLEKVDFGNNLIKDLSPLSQCSRLKSIVIYNNRVEDIDSLLYLKYLDELTTYGNPIQKEKLDLFNKKKNWRERIRYF